MSVEMEDFKKLRENGTYYVDKTLLIKALLDSKGKVNLFTRPRRFGKTLALSMLKYFFEEAHDFKGEPEDNSALFDGLAIRDAGGAVHSAYGAVSCYQHVFKVCKAAGF